MELTGRIISVLEKRSGVSKSTGKNWESQEYVIETQDQYPKKVCFEIFGEDRIRESNIQVMDSVKVSFDVDAREYNGRWFNSIRAWKVEKLTTTNPAETVSPPEGLTTPFMSDLPWDNKGEDDFPF